MKKTYEAGMKFKVALAALTDESIIDICKKYKVAESLVHKWKKQLKEKGAHVFSQAIKDVNKQHEEETAKLYQCIGQLTIELDFLKKVLQD